MPPNLLYSNDSVARYPGSWYADSVNLPEALPDLQESLHCDVCIVGAGFTGLSAALQLAKAGLDVIVLDAHRAGWGASGRNGGQLGSGQRREQTDLEAIYGVGQAQALWDIAQQSKALVSGLIDQYNIECDLRPGIVHADHKARYSEETFRYVEKLRQDYGYHQIEFASRQETSDLLGTTVYHSSSVDLGCLLYTSPSPRD